MPCLYRRTHTKGKGTNFTLMKDTMFMTQCVIYTPSLHTSKSLSQVQSYFQHKTFDYHHHHLCSLFNNSWINYKSNLIKCTTVLIPFHHKRAKILNNNIKVLIYINVLTNTWFLLISWLFIGPIFLIIKVQTCWWLHYKEPHLFSGK